MNHKRKDRAGRRPRMWSQDDGFELSVMPIHGVAMARDELFRKMTVLTDQMLDSGAGPDTVIRTLQRFVEANGWEVVKEGPSTLNEDDQLVYLRQCSRVN